METYFVIITGEDGVRVEAVEKTKLERRLKEEYWGSSKEVLPQLPCGTDPNYWNDSIVIIKGKVVIPQPIEVVKEYRLP